MHATGLVVDIRSPEEDAEAVTYYPSGRPSSGQRARTRGTILIAAVGLLCLWAFTPPDVATPLTVAATAVCPLVIFVARRWPVPWIRLGDGQLTTSGGTALRLEDILLVEQSQGGYGPPSISLTALRGTNRISLTVGTWSEHFRRALGSELTRLETQPTYLGRSREYLYLH